MIKKKLFLQCLCLLLVVTGSAGCDRYTKYFKRKKQREQRALARSKKKLPKKVESIDLASLILKPEPVFLSVEKDPFKPLFYVKNSNVADTPDSVDQGILSTAKILGVTKMGDEYSVLFSMGDIKGVFSVNDDIAGFKLKEIASDFIVLEKEEKLYSIKRGNNE